jgi:N-hydroxyarylamine O-acetyltransferase
MNRTVNLKAYFERIGFAGSIAPTLATLELLHALHPAVIPFENLNPLLGLPVLLDQASLEKKLLAEKRGGYCFEHNLLFMSVLNELDYTVRGLAARVLWSNPSATDVPAHHMLLAIDIAGTTYIADVGFGGLTLTAPLKLRADVEQQTPHETYRLTGGDPEWRLEVKIGEGWRVLYAFDLTEKSEEDYDEPNRFRSSDPQSKFTTELTVALSPAGRRIALSGNRLVVHGLDGTAERRELTSVAEMREVLSTNFGIGLPAADLLDPALEVILANAGVQEV